MNEAVIERVGLGFENYGDHSSSGYVQGSPLWDNNEYDLPAGCLVHFARTGDRQALDLGLAPPCIISTSIRFTIRASMPTGRRPSMFTVTERLGTTRPKAPTCITRAMCKA